ncbi:MULTISPECIES: phage tail protein [unclassified Pantoea]|uniref:phage tail protein n=1 Tax=unclassified Pantoea TaxID=2630326 RepID=UPI0024778CA1|nr:MULTISPECIES: phage tail protein [unclassified Pantoea]GME35410.1 tape measure protein [Pantoea sp. QMID3]GME35542.1 tape measure protein [Pantoea sp. QMID1]GME59682.1 tape measure protein [Pantoea sp. QMID4]GME61186.1 tape measure protein [Pantoea sp. QMID2]
MAESYNAGGIYYEVSIDVDQALKANDVMQKELKALGTQAKGAAGGINTLETQIKSSAIAVNQATKAGGSFRSQFQQAGYQIQDFIVQIQGGQSALVAFSQQGSQLAGAFGPGGAMVGALIALGSVLTGVLMTALDSTGNEMDKLGKAAETLNKIVVINSQGVAALSNDYARLAVTNAALATQLRDAAVAKYAAEIENARKSISNIAAEQTSWWRSLSGGVASVNAAGNALDTLNISTNDFTKAVQLAQSAGPAFRSSAQTIYSSVGMIADKFDISSQSAFELVKQLNDLSKNPTPENVTTLSKALSSMSSSTDSGRVALANFRDEITRAGASVAEAEQRIKDMEASLHSLQTEAQQANYSSISKQLEQQRILLTQGKTAAQLYGLSQQDLTKEQKDALAVMIKNNAAIEDEQDKKKQADQQNKRVASSQESVNQKLEALRQKSEVSATTTGELSREMAILTAKQSLGKSATTEQIRLAGEYAAKIWDNANALKAQAAAEKLKAETEQAGRFSDQQKAAADVAVNPYTGEATNPAAQVELEQKQKLAAVAKYEAMGAMTEQQAQDTRTAIVKQGAYARMQIVKDEAQKQIDSMSMMLGGFQSGFEGLANIVARGAGESSSAYKALFAVSKGFAIAQAGLNLQLAISNAMASGPFPWNLANMAQVAAAGGQVISAIGGASYGGAREHGGPVQANSMYRVGEGGKPEIFKASNGSQYMIPGDNGSVISNKDIGASGGNSPGIQQTNYFTIQSSTGDPQEIANQMAKIAYEQSLRAIRDEQRPGGSLPKKR